jgi:hypothetical protein
MCFTKAAFSLLASKSFPGTSPIFANLAWERLPQGQNRSVGDVGSMSGLAPKADVSTSSRHAA